MKDSTNVVLMALTIWREARGESFDARTGVAFVIRNRVQKPCWWGKTWLQVCFRRWQFSGVTATGDPNLIKWPREDNIADWKSWEDCYLIADKVYRGNLSDPTCGATHYHDTSIDLPAAWGGNMQATTSIGRLRFYK